jgi:hypothetical protein
MRTEILIYDGFEKGREAADDVAAELVYRRDERIWRAVAT